MYVVNLREQECGHGAMEWHQSCVFAYGQGMNPKCPTTCSTGFHLREGKLCNSRYWVFTSWAQSKSDTHFNHLGVTAVSSMRQIKGPMKTFQNVTPHPSLFLSTFFSLSLCFLCQIWQMCHVTTISWSSCAPHYGKLYDGPGSACHPARQVTFSPSAFLFSLSLVI